MVQGQDKNSWLAAARTLLFKMDPTRGHSKRSKGITSVTSTILNVFHPVIRALWLTGKCRGSNAGPRVFERALSVETFMRQLREVMLVVIRRGRTVYCLLHRQ